MKTKAKYGMVWIVKLLIIMVLLALLVVPVAWYFLGKPLSLDSVKEHLIGISKLAVILVALTILFPLCIWKLRGAIGGGQ